MAHQPNIAAAPSAGAPSPVTTRRRRRRPASPATPARPSRPPRRPRGRAGNTRAGNAPATSDANNPLYDPTQQLSGTGLVGAARDLVGLEFDPQRAALNRQLGDVTAQGGALAKRAGDYYGQLAAGEAGNSAREAAIGKLLGETLGGNAAAAQGAITAGDTAARERSALSSSVLGSLGGDPNAKLAVETQAATGRIAGEGQLAKDTAAASTAAYQQLADLSSRARQAQGGEIQGQLLNRMATEQAGVRGKLGDLGATQGAATSKAVTDLRQQAFENLITQRGLNIKTADLKEQTAADQARIAEAAKTRRQRARDAKATRALRREADKTAAAGKADTVNKYGYTNGEWLKMTTKARQDAISAFTRQNTRDTARPKAGTGGPSAKAQDMITQVENAVSDTGTDPKLARHVAETGPRLVQILVKRGLPPLLAQAAAELARYRSIRPTTRAALERAGVKVPSAWLATRPSISGGTGNPASSVGTGLG